jgi:hypothetical protein
MRRLLLIGLACSAALALAAPALAKEMSLLQVCGTNGCNSIKPAVSLGHGGGPTETPAVEDYYLLKIGVGDGTKIFERADLYFAPKAGVFTGAGMAFGDGWSTLPKRAAARVLAAAEGLKLFRAPTPSEIYIEGRRSADPAAYGRLLASLDETTAPVTSEGPILIGLSWSRPNPWSSESLVNYLPKAKVLLRGGGYYRVPSDLASRIDRERRGLSPVAPSEFPWAALAGGLAGAPLVAAGGLLLYRRRRNGGTHAPRE